MLFEPRVHLLSFLEQRPMIIGFPVNPGVRCQCSFLVLVHLLPLILCNKCHIIGRRTYISFKAPQCIRNTPSYIWRNIFSISIEGSLFEGRNTPSLSEPALNNKLRIFVSKRERSIYWDSGVPNDFQYLQVLLPEI